MTIWVVSFERKIYTKHLNELNRVEKLVRQTHLTICNQMYSSTLLNELNKNYPRTQRIKYLYLDSENVLNKV